jgi:hypothetical protein
MHQSGFFKSALLCFDNKSTEKKNLHYNFHPTNFFCYMEHLLKPPHSIVKVVAEDFLKFFPNFVTLKTSSKTFARRCSPCSVIKRMSRIIFSIEVLKMKFICNNHLGSYRMVISPWFFNLRNFYILV